MSETNLPNVREDGTSNKSYLLACIRIEQGDGMKLRGTHPQHFSV